MPAKCVSQAVMGGIRSSRPASGNGKTRGRGDADLSGKGGGALYFPSSFFNSLEESEGEQRRG